MFLKFKTYFLIFIILIFNSCSKKEKESASRTMDTLNTRYTLGSNLENKDFFADLIKDFEKTRNFYTNPDNAIEQINKIQKSFSVASSSKKYEMIFSLLKKFSEIPVLNDSLKIKHDSLSELLTKLYLENSEILNKNLHFVWIGGPLGEAQKEYLKIWAEINPDYEISVWYDSDYLYSYETNSLIKEAILKSQSFKLDPEHNKSSEFIIQTQNKLHAYLKQRTLKKSTLSLDEERIMFLNENVYKSNVINSNKVEENKKLMQNDIENLNKKYANIKFKDIKIIKGEWKLKDPYFQEINLRSNLAAASDIARIEILNQFGGIYSDLDILPRIKALDELLDESLDLEIKKYIRSKENNISLAFYKELVKNSIYKMNNRDKIDRKENMISSIRDDNELNEEQKNSLLNLFEEKINKVVHGKNSIDIFNKLGDIYIKKGEFKTAIKSNCIIATHASTEESDWIKQISNTIKDNYNNLNSYSENNPGNFYEKNLNFNKNPKNNLTNKEYNYLKALSDYRFDSIKPEYKATISISGPGVFLKFITSKIETIRINDPYISKFLQATFYFTESNRYFSTFTQEEIISSWRTKIIKNDANNIVTKNIIMQIGNENNTKEAANYIYENNKKELDQTILVDDFLKNITNEEIHTAKLIIVGHAVQDLNEIKIGNLSAHELAEKINIFYIKNKIKELVYIDFITCNPTNNKNNTKMIENYVKSVMRNLSNNNIYIDIASARNKQIKVKSDGTELTNIKLNLYRNSDAKDKIYIIQKNNEFLEIDSQNIYSTKKSKITNFAEIIRNILAEKSSVLGDFETTIKELQAANEILVEKEKIVDIIKKIQSTNSLDIEYIPILSNLHRNSSQIDFIHSKTGEYKSAFVFEQYDLAKLIDIKNKTNSELEKISTLKLSIDENGIIETHGLGLTPMFMTQALLSYFRNDGDNFLSEDETLNKALKIHSILNDTQIAINVLETSVQLKNVLKNLITSGSLEQTSPFILKFATTNLQKLGMGANVILNLGSIGLDAYELAKAKTGYEKIVFGTQLSFDISGLSLGALQLGTSALAATEIGSTLGFATASSIIGYLGVPFTGFAIGFNGLAHTAAQAQGESVDMAHYFFKYDKDHEKTGEFLLENKNIISLAQHNFTRKSNQLHADSNSALIQTIDLSEKNNLKITFDSHYMYKTKGKYGKRPKYYSIFDTQPAADISRTCSNRNCDYNFNELNSFSVLEALSLERSKNIKINNETAIVLPAMPKKKISYGYSYTIGIFSRNDAELKTVRRMEKHQSSKFLFEFMADLYEYAIRGMDFITEKYDIKIKLGKQNRTLISPELESQNIGKISYTLESLKGGSHTLFLSKDIQNYQFKVSEHANWFIHATSTQANEFNLVRKEQNLFLYIGNSVLHFDKNPKSLVIKIANGNSYAIINDKKYLISIEGEFFQNNVERLKEFILNEKSKGSLVKNYKYVENFISNSKGVWVNTENFEIINPVFPYGIDDHSVDLVTKINDEIFFYIPTKLQILVYNIKEKKISSLLQAVKKVEIKGNGILIELNTSQLNHFSKLKLFLKDSKNISVDSLSLYGRYIEFQNFEQAYYYIKERLEDDEKSYLFDYNNKIKLDDVFTINSKSWIIPQIKSITYLNDNDLNSYLIRRLIKFEKNGNTNSFLFFVDKFSNFEIYRQNGELSTPEKIDILDISDIQYKGQEILIHTKNGLIFQLDENYNPIVIGFDHNWLKNHENANLENELQKQITILETKYIISNCLYLLGLSEESYIYNRMFKFIYRNSDTKSFFGITDKNILFTDINHKIYSISLSNSLTNNFYIKKTSDNLNYYLSSNLNLNFEELKNQDIELKIINNISK